MRNAYLWKNHSEKFVIRKPAGKQIKNWLVVRFRQKPFSIACQGSRKIGV